MSSITVRSDSDTFDLDISTEDYRRRFDNIRVALDWRDLGRKSWQAHGVRLNTRRQLLGLRSFFGERFGRINPRFLKTLGTRSMLVAEAAARIAEFPPAQRDLILSWADDYRSGKLAARLEMPGYCLDDGSYLLLDGNHHATALAIADIQFEVELVAVRGGSTAGFAGMRFP